MALLPFGKDASEETNIVELLRKDHEKVKNLFREFESAGTPDEKQSIAQQVIAELEVHASAEEKVFYPAVRQDSPDAASTLDESCEEHHVMRLLLGELKDMSPTDKRYDAKFTVMAENVTHHVKEEEAELFARARTGYLDLIELGKQLLAAKASFGSKKTVQKRKVTSKKSSLRNPPSSKRGTTKKPSKRTAA